MQSTQHIHEPLKALRQPPNERSPGDSGSEPEKKPESSTKEGRSALYCKGCLSKVTRPELGMRIDGKHRHVFFNPHGYVFELGCFASARNVVPAGPKTDEFTWFPGYAWQVVACTGCAAQLGWRYTGTDGGFYGLILKNLTEQEDNRP